MEDRSSLELLTQLDLPALSSLTILDLRGLELTAVPTAVKHCSKLVQLDVGNNPLQTLPDCLAELPQLEILFASGTQLAELPSVLHRCHKLRILGIKDSLLTSIDGSLLPEFLEWLIVAGNRISSLSGLGRLSRLRKLMLSHNQLTCSALAPLVDMPALEMVRVAANRLESFPDALLRHPRLCWIAIGDNPFTAAALERRLCSASAAANFGEVSLGDRLGSGAGATVYSGRWREQQVAVKIWEAERFSDGTSRGEWGVNRVAGQPGHPSLVGVLSTFQEPRPGMVLELLEGASPAAGAPTFATVTRDALPGQDGAKGPTYSAEAAVVVAQRVAQACEYLAAKGILHGDIYLHNTLVSWEKGSTAGHCSRVLDARLSDFGAAAIVENEVFEKFEVRSFGWMLQDLLESVRPCGGESSELQLLKSLRAKCAGEDVSTLPRFSELVVALGGAGHLRNEQAAM